MKILSDEVKKILNFTTCETCPEALCQGKQLSNSSMCVNCQAQQIRRLVRELLDGKTNPYEATENYCYVLPNRDYALCSNMASSKYFAYGFDVAIQTIKALLEE